jgi:hypothetical protein
VIMVLGSLVCYWDFVDVSTDIIPSPGLYLDVYIQW